LDTYQRKEVSLKRRRVLVQRKTGSSGPSEEISLIQNPILKTPPQSKIGLIHLTQVHHLSLLLVMLSKKKKLTKVLGGKYTPSPLMDKVLTILRKKHCPIKFLKILPLFQTQSRTNSML
jgi:hypothetical protein